MNCDASPAPKRQRPGGDHRGSAASRRARKHWMLNQERWNGDGVECDCALGIVSECAGRVTFLTVEADRIVPGGSYGRHNVQPACRACNAARSDKPMSVFAAAAAA
jgi:hypothetical protein